MGCRESSTPQSVGADRALSRNSSVAQDAGAASLMVLSAVPLTPLFWKADHGGEECGATSRLVGRARDRRHGAASVAVGDAPPGSDSQPKGWPEPRGTLGPAPGRLTGTAWLTPRGRERAAARPVWTEDGGMPASDLSLTSDGPFAAPPRSAIIGRYRTGQDS